MTTITKKETKKDPLAPYRGKGTGHGRGRTGSVTVVSPAAGESDSATSLPEPAGTNKQAYEAFKFSNSTQRHLEIRLKFPEPAVCPLNAMITNIRVEWRWGMGLTLIYGTSMVIDIDGERLQPLFEALREWRVLWLAEFDPENHSDPVDDDVPLITRINIVTERPEPLPPMNERH